MADNLSTLLASELVKQGLAISPAAVAVVDAKAKVVDTTAAAKSARRTACIALAKFSAANKLSSKDILAGIKAAKADFAKNGANAKMSDKTFANFASEAKAAMHPNVRDGYAALVTMAEGIFKESKAETQIVRDAFTAPAFMVNSVAAKVAKGEAKMPANDAACKAIATKHVKGKAEDVTRCRSAIERIKEKIAAEKRTFPLDAFDKMIALCDALCAEDVLENALKAASNAGKLRKGKGAQGASNIGTTLDNLNA